MNDIGCGNLRTDDIFEDIQVSYDYVYNLIQGWNVEDLQEFKKDCDKLIKEKSK